ncbi:MAG: cupin domain-containing protein [Terriglobia bacterium]
MNPQFSRKYVNGEKIMIAQLFLKKGCIVPDHSHESEQLSMVVTGKVVFMMEGEEQLLHSNQLVLIPSNKVHSVVALEDSLIYDLFSPIRHDWLEKKDSYLRK